MAVRLYLVMGDETLLDYLVCAKTADDAVNYVVKNVKMKFMAKPATPMQVAMFKDNNHQAILGEAADLAEWQAHEKLNETKRS